MDKSEEECGAELRNEIGISGRSITFKCVVTYKVTRNSTHGGMRYEETMQNEEGDITRAPRQ